MPLESINEFEDLNNLSINVYGVEGMRITPLRASTRENARDSIDLLLVEDGDSRHYALKGMFFRCSDAKSVGFLEP